MEAEKEGLSHEEGSSQKDWKPWKDLFRTCPEARDIILDRMDMESALACRVVCKDWRATINNYKKLWAKINKATLDGAVKAGDVLLTELIIAKRGEIDKETRKRLLKTAILIDLPEKIASKSDIGIVGLLISIGADVNDPTTIEGKRISPVLLAARQCKAEIVQLLIENGAEFEIDCLSILRAPLLTRKNGYLETLKALLAAGGDPNIADVRAMPVLATALDLPLTDSPLQSPDFEGARILIESGADVNCRYGCPLLVHSLGVRGGTTLLHRAVWRYRLDVINFLLENGAQANALAYANPMDEVNGVFDTTPLTVAGRVENYLAIEKLAGHYEPLKAQYKVEDCEAITEALKNGGAVSESLHELILRQPLGQLTPLEIPPFANLLFPKRPPDWGHHDKADAKMRMTLRELRQDRQLPLPSPSLGKTSTKTSVLLEITLLDGILIDSLVPGEIIANGIEKGRYGVEGVVCGANRLVQGDDGNKKVQLICVVEDEKVSINELIHKLQEFYDDDIDKVEIISTSKI